MYIGMVKQLYDKVSLFNGELHLIRDVSGFKVATSKNNFCYVLAESSGVWYVNELYRDAYPEELEFLLDGIDSYEIAPASKVMFIARRKTGAKGYERRYMRDGDVRKWKNSLL